MPFGGLTIATSGMRVAQRNLNITGHNIANAETPGFSRQRITQVHAKSRNVGTNAMGHNKQIGLGVDWTSVHQIRNDFLDINFRNSSSILSFYSATAQAGTAVQTILGELHGAYNFQTVINEIWYAIQELTAMPEGLATRQFFLSTAKTFITKSHDVFENLFEQQVNLDMQIREIVHGSNGINATVQAIADMNIVIRAAEANGDRANDYRDERNRLVDHLATMIPVDVREGMLGEVNITSLGHHIVTNTTVSFMGLRFISSEAPFVEPVFTTETEILRADTPPSEFTSYLNYNLPLGPVFRNDRGSLLALLQARGTAPKNHLSPELMPPLSMQELVDAATTYASIDYVPPELIARDNNRFIRRLMDEGQHIDLMREIDRQYEAERHNHRAHLWSLEHGMIPQVQKNLDRVINNIATMINDALTGNLRNERGEYIFGNPPRDLNGNLGVPLFVRVEDVLTDNITWPLTDHDVPENAHHFETIFTANNLRINPVFMGRDGHNHLALSQSGAIGDTDLLVALQRMWMLSSGPYAIEMTTLNTQGVQIMQNFNVQDAYIRMVGQLATETAEAATKVSAQTINVDQAHSIRMAVKGVSMDEEMAAMLRFQFAFQAASRVFNAIDGMIDRIINGTGRV